MLKNHRFQQRSLRVDDLNISCVSVVRFALLMWIFAFLYSDICFLWFYSILLFSFLSPPNNGMIRGSGFGALLIFCSAQLAVSRNISGIFGISLSDRWGFDAVWVPRGLSLTPIDLSTSRWVCSERWRRRYHGSQKVSECGRTESESQESCCDVITTGLLLF